jgi:hypothetical protein
MKRLGFLLALALCSCGASVENFSGRYVGVITEDYRCANSSPPVFQLTEEFDIGQNGSAVTVTLASCNGLPINGSASNNEINIEPTGQTTNTCQQADPNGGSTISIDGFPGGSLILNGGVSLDVNLLENATVNGDSCTGTATGTLTLQ